MAANVAPNQDEAAVRPQIFIQTNNKQSIGAIVSAYSMKRNSAHGDDFDVTIMHQEENPNILCRGPSILLYH